MAYWDRTNASKAVGGRPSSHVRTLGVAHKIVTAVASADRLDDPLLILQLRPVAVPQHSVYKGVGVNFLHPDRPFESADLPRS